MDPEMSEWFDERHQELERERLRRAYPFARSLHDLERAREYEFACDYLGLWREATYGDGNPLELPDYRDWWEYPGETDPRSMRKREEDYGAWRAERVIRKWEKRMANSEAHAKKVRENNKREARAAPVRRVMRVLEQDGDGVDEQFANEWLDDPRT